MTSHAMHDEEVEVFYEEIKKAMDNTKTSDINIVMGDFSAKVGRGWRDNIIGEYRLRTQKRTRSPDGAILPRRSYHNKHTF